MIERNIAPSCKKRCTLGAAANAWAVEEWRDGTGLLVSRSAAARDIYVFALGKGSSDLPCAACEGGGGMAESYKDSDGDSQRRLYLGAFSPEQVARLCRRILRLMDAEGPSSAGPHPTDNGNRFIEI